MGQAPLSGTDCPFPLANTSSTAMCSQICSDVLGARYLGLQITCLLVSSVSMVVYFYQMFHMYNRYKMEQRVGGPKARQSALRKSFAFWFYVFLFAACFLISSIDIRGNAGILNPVVYVIFNEISAASLVCVGLCLIDFWISCASPSGKSGIAFRRSVIVFVYVNYIVLAMIGMLDVEHFMIYDGVKGIVASIIIVTWAVLAFKPTRAIKQTLLGIHGSSDELNKVESASMRRRHQKMVAELNRKFTFFYVVITIGAILFLFSGIMSFLSKDPVTGYRWKIPCEIGAVVIFSKGVQIIGCILVFSFFTVPKGSGSASDHSSAHKKDLNGAVTALVPSIHREELKCAATAPS